ncbi:hypothetical protein [Thalassospira sp. TSL5-1]|uniref:hypothetical protein n=1 Tax=Thalassospira sp. TSL5-1 TaxID=1544451 RepID=UPI000939D8D8|nr:hypothetical protein [Thalassospira sp. TSL5-1]
MMMECDPFKRPSQFPTHRHPPEFWEQFGRAIATFGFLEEMLGRAIIAITGSKQVPETDAQEALDVWQKIVEKALHRPLGVLIDMYHKALKDHPKAHVLNVDELIEDLKKVAQYRNPLCHGSWRIPDGNGFSELFYIDRELRIFDTPLDQGILEKLQVEASTIACRVYNSITQLGCKPL